MYICVQVYDVYVYEYALLARFWFTCMYMSMRRSMSMCMRTVARVKCLYVFVYVVYVYVQVWIRGHDVCVRVCDVYA